MVDDEEVGLRVGVKTFGKDGTQGSYAGGLSQVGADDQIGSAKSIGRRLGLLLILDDWFGARKPGEEVWKRGWHDVCDVLFAQGKQEVPHGKAAAHSIAVRILMGDDGNGVCLLDALGCVLQLQGR